MSLSLSPARLQKHLERLQQSLPAALLRRFVEIDVMTQAASLSFYALLSLAPLLVLLLWLTASLYPQAQQAFIEQIERGQLEIAADLLRLHLRLSAAQRPQTANRGIPQGVHPGRR